MRNRVSVFLEDMTYNTGYKFLEEGKDHDELQEIAAKRDIRLPAVDLSIFKGIYAFVDRMNKNKCTLPREEVVKALDTLNDKAIDFDHFRKNVVGHWIDAKIEGDEIIAYGIFYKGNFREDFATIKQLMEDDVLAISFEAWGDREFNEDGSYDLTDIEFAGGALLIKTKPAFPGSEVLELSSKNPSKRVLELAKVLTPPDRFIQKKVVAFSSGHEKVNDRKDHLPMNTLEQAKVSLERAEEYTTAPKWYDGSLSEVKNKVQDIVQKRYPSLEISVDERARLHTHDLDTIMRILREVDCVNCEETGFADVDSIDFKRNTASIHCLNCDAEMAVTLTPQATLSKKGRKITDVARINHDSAKVAGDNIDSVDTEQVKEAKQSMKTLMEKYKVETVAEVVQAIAKASIGRELSEEELQFAFTLVEYKRAGGDVNMTSLMALKGKTLMANPTSLLSASISEEEVTSLISEIAKMTKAEEEAPAAEETPKETPAPAADAPQAPAEETPAATPAEETPSEATAEAAAKAVKAKDVEIAALQARIVKFEKAQKEKEAKDKAKLLKARREELGEFSDKLSDEQILDDDKFTIARQTKTISMLKAGEEVTEEELGLSKGSTDKGEDAEADSRRRVQELAWGTPDEPVK